MVTTGTTNKHINIASSTNEVAISVAPYPIRNLTLFQHRCRDMGLAN